MRSLLATVTGRVKKYRACRDHGSCTERFFTAKCQKSQRLCTLQFVSFSEIGLLFSCLNICGPTRGPRRPGPGLLNRLNPRFLRHCSVVYPAPTLPMGHGTLYLGTFRWFSIPLLIIFALSSLIPLLLHWQRLVHST